ncbi:hypothetical protein P4O66_005409 [Electrophorus voltai]|uniref:Immunoglobulin domain-containing protein n=1 Tax=Electrophorus voltai TaxID=2609070 RepID=A0AAD9E6K7_9TELE|nr:hypothetical protein P4O66_005409 [Electrophorus voltai]
MTYTEPDMNSYRTLVFSMLLLQISVILPQQIIEVKQNEAATLPCNQICSGLVTWTVFLKRRITPYVVAECNQTSCQFKKRFKMSHDQYLKGDLSLTITNVDVSKRTRYKCECDGVKICDVRLRLEPLSLAVHVKRGQSLIMDVPVSDLIWLFFTGDASQNHVRLCALYTYEKVSSNFWNEYENRVFSSTGFQLRELKESDSGLYSIQSDFFSEVFRVNVNASSIQPGVTLTLKLPSSAWLGFANVSVNKADDDTANSVRMCDILMYDTECISEYEKRVSLSLSLQLKEMKESDSGVYTLWDMRNDEVIATYTVNVNDTQSSQVDNAVTTAREVIPTHTATTVTDAHPRVSQIVIEVKRNETATLPCSQTCSSSVRWTVFHMFHSVLAYCHEKTCRLNVEGFQMSHDQYLKGDLSLTITDADYTKSGRYTCECDHVKICDVKLRIEPLSLAVHVERGQSLVMDVPVLGPVEVFFTSTSDASPNPVKLCDIEGHRIWCNWNEYKNRMSFSSSLQLRELKESDSGVYTIQDAVSKEILATYRVNVNDSSVQPRETFTLQWPSFVLVIYVSFSKSNDDTAHPDWMCMITRFGTDCNEKRVLLSSSLQLKEMKEPDSGVYTIRDIWNDEVIGTYTVTVNGSPLA